MIVYQLISIDKIAKIKWFIIIQVSDRFHYKVSVPLE